MEKNKFTFYSEEFLGSNTARGFVSLYEDFLDYFIRKHDNPFVYVIKGGPGSGKSTFIRKVCELLGSKNCDVRVLKCSGDCSSLDGVYSEKAGIMVLDGTSPHCIEVKKAGLDGVIVNFGEFWNLDVLKQFKNDISSLTARKQEAYSEAYGFLSDAGKVYDIGVRQLSRTSWFKPWKSEFRELTETLTLDVLDYFGKQRKKGLVSKGFATAVTAEGVSGDIKKFIGSDYTDFNVFEINVPMWAYVNDEMKLVAEKISASGYDVRLGICGFDGKSIEHVIVPEIKCAFVSSKFNTDIVTSLNPKLGLMFDELMDNAKKALENAREAHSAMENYYIKAMDFNKLNKYIEKILKI